MRGEFLDLNGVRLYYYAAGSRGAGEPIVLLHGFPTSSHLWRPVVPLLREGHRVVVLDLLGFGRSDPPGGRDVTLGAHADRVVSVLDALAIDMACLVGHDIGGGIAQAMAVRYPHRVSRLCLVSSVAFDGWPTRGARIARAVLPFIRHLPPALMLSALRAELRRGYVDQERGAHEIERYLRAFGDTDGRRALMAHLGALQCGETEALASRLGEIAAPTAIVWGERDPFLPARLGQRLHAAIPGSTLEILTDARHFIPGESAHAVAAAIGRLLSA